MKKAVVVVAGGSGSRMKCDIPKQFLTLRGKPILMHTITKFYSYDSSIEIIVVLPEKEVESWRRLCVQHGFTVPHLVATGGKTRFHSVKNGLSMVKDADVVAVHDGVRPLVSLSVLERSFNTAKEHRAVVPAIPSVDSLRIVENGVNRALDRASVRLIQTPQVFDYRLLLEAYNQPFDEKFTDDASVVERYGHSIELVDGNVENIKITNPIDLIFAEQLFDEVR